MAVQTLGNPTDWDMLKRFEWFERSQVPIWIWILLIWAAFVFPAISLRGFHYEEGYIVGVARGAIEDSNWLAPHLYGWRFVERPNLMAWLVAALGLISGGVNQWVARAPAVLSLLAGCFLVFWLVRRYAGALAALFAAGCLIISPLVLQKLIVAEPDMLVSVILFAAFIVWWNGLEADGIGPLRWLAIGAILALAALVKGPQPLAYFGFGAFAFHLWRRQWLDIIGLAVAGVIAALVSAAWYWWVYEPGDIDVWMWHSRIGYDTPIGTRIVEALNFVGMLLLESLPALIVVVPFSRALMRKSQSKRDDLAIALLLYAVCCTAILIFWPGAKTRYAMPGIFALAAVAGLAFERFRVERPKLVNLALLVGTGLAVYQIALSWLIMPAQPDLFRQTRSAAMIISSAIAAQPAPLYVASESLNKNIMGYVHEPFRVTPFDDVRRVAPPAWALVSPQQGQQLRQARPELAITVRASFSNNGVHQLMELRGK